MVRTAGLSTAAPPDFPFRPVAFMDCMRLSEKKHSYLRESPMIGKRNSRSLHFGRDDNSVLPAAREPGHPPTQQQHCHPDRSGGTCCFASPVPVSSPVGRQAGGQLYGEPHTWPLPAFAKWEFRVRSGPNEPTRESPHGRADSFPTSRQKRARYGAQLWLGGSFNGCASTALSPSRG